MIFDDVINPRLLCDIYDIEIEAPTVGEFDRILTETIMLLVIPKRKRLTGKLLGKLINDRGFYVGNPAIYKLDNGLKFAAFISPKDVRGYAYYSIIKLTKKPKRRG